MAELFRIHPDNPQGRLVRKAADIVRGGGILAYPTDSGYALGCHLGDKTAHDRLCALRQVGPHHNFTLLCRGLSDAGVYAAFDTPVYRLLKAHTPGPYTFVLRAEREVPKRLIHPKKRTIGLRIPDHPISQALLAELGEPLLTTTLILPGDGTPLSDPPEILGRIGRLIELVIDGGHCGATPTTVVDMMEFPYRILRRGKGDPSPFE